MSNKPVRNLKIQTIPIQIVIQNPIDTLIVMLFTLVTAHLLGLNVLGFIFELFI